MVSMNLHDHHFTDPHPVPPVADDKPDRRRGSRHVTVFFIARMTCGGDQGFGRVLNISDGGMMISARVPLMLGDAVTVVLSEIGTLTGNVVWRDSDWAGLKLTTPIDSLALLNRLNEERRHSRRRSLRLPVDKPAVAMSEFGIQVVRLRDLSQRGAKVIHDGRFYPGLSVKIQVTPGHDRRGFVRWSSDGIAGLEFLEVLSVDDLSSAKAINEA